MWLTARGASLEAAFADMAMAVLGLAVDPGRVEQREVREVRAHGATAEMLLERWIDECLYVHEVEGFAPGRIEFVVFRVGTGGGGAEPLRLHALLHGELLAPSHAPRGEPAAVARDPAVGATIRQSAEGYEVGLALA